MSLAVAPSLPQPGFFGSVNTPARFTVYVALGQILLLSLLVHLDLIVFFPLLLIGAMLLYISAKNLFVWIPLAILGHSVLFLQKTGQVTLTEVGFGVFFYGILLIWLARHFFIERNEISIVYGDWWLVAFICIGLLSIIPALMFSNNLFLWLREYLVFMGLLFYFPLREAMKGEKGRKILLSTFLVLALIIALRNIWEYKSRIALAAYVWELLGGRQGVHESLFMVMIIVGAAVWMFHASPRIRLTALAGVSFFSVALVMTFSRGYWVATLIGLAVLLWLGNQIERRRLLGISALVTVSSLVVLMIGFSDVFVDLVSTIVQRFSTAVSATEDRSFANRLVESAKVWELIQANPFVGYGLGAKFSYHHLLYGYAFEDSYIHNGYLYIWHKLGLPGLVVFLVAFLTKIVRGVKLSRIIESPIRPWVLAATTTLLVMLLLSFTSPQFYSRDSVLIICLCWATIESCMSERKGGDTMSR
ncbi:MAG: O-antigen ligase family protein [Bacteroidota bacterium]